MPTDFERGVLVGLLVGEGHFGGDGRQPQVTLRMHVRHVRLFQWIDRTFPGGRLYGPYHHGGRDYYQWMARGEFLREVVVPMLQSSLEGLDNHSGQRFRRMCERYSRSLRLNQSEGDNSERSRPSSLDASALELDESGGGEDSRGATEPRGASNVELRANDIFARLRGQGEVRSDDR